MLVTTRVKVEERKIFFSFFIPGLFISVVASRGILLEFFLKVEGGGRRYQLPTVINDKLTFVDN